jgi:hypothetical protein
MQKEIVFGFAIILIGVVLIYSILQGNMQQTELKNKIENYFLKNFNISINVTNIKDIGSVYRVSLYLNGRTLYVLASKDGKYLFPSIINLSAQNIPQTELKNKIESFFSSKNISVNVTSIQDIGSIYRVSLYFEGMPFNIFASKDGRYLFPSIINLSAQITTTSIPPFSPKPSTFPDVKLFVMSFCPYGTQAELFMKPVYEAFKNNANFSLIFIVDVNGNDLSSVNSLHGSLEVLEDARQICIQKLYGKDTLWNYVENFDKNCYPDSVQDKNLYTTCTLNEEKNLNINSTLIQNCMNSSEVIQTLKEHQNLTQQYNAYGSPTLVINNSTYNDNFGRSVQAYQKAICLAFLSPPSACSQNLNSSSSSSTSTGKC